MTRDEIVAEIEALALHAQASDLASVHDLLHYVAGAIEQSSENVILRVLVEATIAKTPVEFDARNRP